MTHSQPNIVLDYQLGRILGRGGYGAVYQGLHIENGGFVAIKQINIATIPKDQIGGIMTEIDLLKKLKHDNIVKYIGYQKTKDHLNIILEFVENGSLASIIKSVGRFPESLVRVYITQVLAGLLYLHDQGVVHRDIKGANILVTKKGHVKLADFGVASDKFSTGGGSDNTNLEVAGTPYWMAPEIIELTGASPNSDIWSVGCTVIELITGQPPYFDLAPMPALFRIVQDDHPPLPAELSPALKDFLMECFQKDPLLRIDARGLLKHPWVKSTIKSKNVPTNFEDIRENIINYNEELERTTIRTSRYVVQKELEAMRQAEEKAKAGRPASKPTVQRQKTIPKPKITPAPKPKPAPAPRDEEDWEEDWDDLELEGFKASPTPVLKEVPTATTPTTAATPATPATTPKPVASTPKDDFKPTIGKDNSRPTSITKPEAKTLKEESKSKEKEQEKDIKDSRGRTKRSKTSKRKTSKRSPSAPVEDEGTWGDEPAKSIVSPRKHKSSSSSSGNKDRSKRSKSKKKRNKEPAVPPKLNIEDFKETEDEEDWGDFELSLAPASTPSGGGGATSSSGANKDDDDIDFDNVDLDDVGGLDDLDLGGGFDFAAKLQKLEKQQEAEPDDFDDFDDIFDDEDFQTGTRDNFVAISNDVTNLLKLLNNSGSSPDIIASAVEEMIVIFKENSQQKSRLIRHSGVIQILEILETIHESSIHLILQLTNQIIEDNSEIQENLCLVGGLPAILHYADKKYSKSVRVEVAKFMKQVSSGSKLTHQMFIACRGLPFLVSFLDTDNYQADRDLVFMAVDGILSVFELQSTTPKNDFCRLFVKCEALKYLANALKNSIQDTESDNAKEYTQKILEILVLFSTGDVVVKEHMTEASGGGVLETLFDCMDLLKVKDTAALVTLLKAIKQLSTDSTTFSSLQIIGAIPRLIRLFSLSEDLTTDLVNQLVFTLYNLTRIDRVRQEQAARAGLVPYLQKIINVNSPLKQLALEIILDFGKVPGGRSELWKYDGVKYFLNLLSEINWRVNVFDVLSIWLSDERKVQEVIVQQEYLSQLINAFITTSGVMFANLVQPFLRVLQASSNITRNISQNNEFVSCILDALKVNSYDPRVRVSLMRILMALYENHPNQKQMIATHNLRSVVTELLEDHLLLIIELASKLMVSLKAVK